MPGEKDERVDADMDRLLHETLGGSPIPALSARFEQQVAKRLSPRPRLDRRGVLVLALYSILALGASVWTLRSVALDWSMIAAAVLTPFVLAAILYERARRLS
jgi:hypothetical protein